jgi:hypothetical protein
MGTAAIYILVLGGIGFYIWSLRGSGGSKQKPRSEPRPDEAPKGPAPGAWTPQGPTPRGDDRGYGAPRDPRGPGWGV